VESPFLFSDPTLGSYNTDLIAFCDQLPCEGKILLGAEFTISGGGRGANCAVARLTITSPQKWLGPTEIPGGLPKLLNRTA
jgi:hypothetical protein